MSESEDDIWGYKSLRKRRAAERSADKTSSHAGSHAGSPVQGKKKAATNPSSAGKKKSPARNVLITGPAKEHHTPSPGPRAEDSPTPRRTLKADAKKASPSTPKAAHSGCCPGCQMPFSILLVQTPRWHVSECLDTSPAAQTECPDGLSCSSTIASHYKRYSHFLLAQSRATELSPFPPICPPDLPSPDNAKSHISNGWKDAKCCQGDGGSTNVRSSQARSPASSQRRKDAKCSQDAGCSTKSTNVRSSQARSPASSQRRKDAKCCQGGGSSTKSTNVRSSQARSPASSQRRKDAKCSQDAGCSTKSTNVRSSQARSPASSQRRKDAKCCQGGGSSTKSTNVRSSQARSPASSQRSKDAKCSQGGGCSTKSTNVRSSQARSPAGSQSRKDAKCSQGAGCSTKSTNVRSSQARSPASSQGSVKQSSLDAWLSSPTKSSQKSLDLSQEIPSQKSADEDYDDIGHFLISYSPLVSDQELFSDDEDIQAGPVKKLFPDKSSAENVEERFAANEHFITESRLKSPAKCDANPNDTSASRSDFVRSSGVARVADCSVEGDDWSECSTPVSEVSERSPAQQQAECRVQEEVDDLLVGSANGYREAASPLRGRVAAATVEKEFCASTQPATRQFPNDSVHTKLSLTQIPSEMPSGSAAPSKAMRQMDIGVFFGLKPKSKPVEKAEVKAPLKTQSPNAGASQVEEKWPRKRKDAGSLTGNTGGIPAAAPSGTQRRKRKAAGSLSDADTLTRIPGGVTAPSWNQERKRFRQNSTAEESKGRKQCPFYKKIPGTGFTVDAFQYGAIEGCSAYFLTHFHSDHYGGLTKKFRYPIYCSKITGNLVASKLRVEKEFISTLPMDTECMVDNVKVILLDANHCPGAVLLLFILQNGTAILHTGDFRADTSMERYPALIGRKINTLYLDTTYCSPEYTFPPQQEAIQFAVNAAFEMVTLHPRTLVVCGTYSVGKEKVFLAIADVLGCKVCMSVDKYRTMQCLESDEIRALVTTDWLSTALHVLPMMQVNFKGLGAHLHKFSGKYDRVLAFKPTGWTYSDGCSSVADIRPEIRGKITMYGIPYSEHSSYLEMKRFVQFTRPHKIIPTVNVGNWKARSVMEKYFAEWLLEARLK